MAHPTASLPLGGISVSQPGSLVERAVAAFVALKVRRAADVLSRYETLGDRYGRTKRRRLVPARPTLGWLVSAEVAAWKTVDELAQHSDRTLEDIQIPREAIRAIAVLSAFGWPREDRPAPSAGLLATLRQRYFPDDAALQEAYLAQATDIYDLEYRMAEWESRHGARTAAGLRVR